jgi:hypothetical protein
MGLSYRVAVAIVSALIVYSAAVEAQWPIPRPASRAWRMGSPI